MLPREIVARADLRVTVELTQRHVRYAGVGVTGESCVLEIETAVLVIGAAGNAVDVHLVAVVLAGALKHKAKLKGMVGVHP
jgi:hypothetical protein